MHVVTSLRLSAEAVLKANMLWERVKGKCQEAGCPRGA